MIYSYDLCIYAGSIYEKMNLYHVSLKARGGNEGSLIMFYFLHVKVLLIVTPKSAHLPHNSWLFGFYGPKRRGVYSYFWENTENNDFFSKFSCTDP